DMEALQRITAQVAQSTGAKPSPGQLVSIIVRDYLSSGSARSPESAVSTTAQQKVQEHIRFIAASALRSAEIVNQASAIQQQATAIETTAKQIKQDIDSRLEEVLRLLQLQAD